MLEKSKKYTKLGQKMLKRPEFADIVDSGARIAFIVSDEEKQKNRKIVFADCNLVNKRYSWCCNYDFFIVVYEPNCLSFTEKQLEILMIHELHHIGVDWDSEEPKFYIVPHDIEEFYDIINEFGIDWAVA